MEHLLSLFDYQDLTPKKFELPGRAGIKGEYVRSPIDEQTFIPEVYPKPKTDKPAEKAK
ncbi:MAG: hypothetical protein GY697_13200 [Desulfobacterales bacterium]|nr:hypothetical protein [Desulfobacterales bacterium]